MWLKGIEELLAAVEYDVYHRMRLTIPATFVYRGADCRRARPCTRVLRKFATLFEELGR